MPIVSSVPMPKPTADQLTEDLCDARNSLLEDLQGTMFVLDELEQKVLLLRNKVDGRILQAPERPRNVELKDISLGDIRCVRRWLAEVEGYVEDILALL